MKLNASDDLLSKREDCFLLNLDKTVTKGFFLDLHCHCFDG